MFQNITQIVKKKSCSCNDSKRRETMALFSGKKLSALLTGKRLNITVIFIA